MKVVILALFVALAAAAPQTLQTVKLNAKAMVDLPDFYLHSRAESIINAVNSDPTTTWTAGHNVRFANASRSFILGQMGALEIKPRHIPTKEIKVGAVPTSFDSRTNPDWRACASMSEIRDQSACGSCWAFGAVEAMTDRICVASKGQSTPHISAEDLLSCCGALCGQGCNGGHLEQAWMFYQRTGLVTGGNYGSKQGCYPYALPNCDHHVSGQYQPCGSIVPTPACVKQCEAGYSPAYPQDKHHGATTYAVTGEDQIATEIMTNGPVEAAFSVYEDFLSYKSGVYIHKTGQLLGGHAIKILGWGVDSGVKYWIVANSWNTDWGNAGFFNIRKGTDECGIEDGVVAGLPKL